MTTKMSAKITMSGVGAGALIALIMLIPGMSASHAQSSEVRALLSYDGLEEVKNRNLDLLYVQPGATLAAYEKVWLDPVEVAFHRSWNPDRRSVNARDRERIRRQVAETFDEIFAEELRRGGYEITSSAGPDVLRVSAAIINLYITAPDTLEAGRTRTYVMSPGEMTLVAELRDSESGAILARVVDRRGGRSTGMLHWVTRATNAGEGRRILRIWAGVLRNGLDSARASET